MNQFLIECNAKVGGAAVAALRNAVGWHTEAAAVASPLTRWRRVHRLGDMRFSRALAACLTGSLFLSSLCAEGPVSGKWAVGTPIVSYFAGPGFPGGSDLNDASAQQLVEGGWNVVWCREAELDTVAKHGLRGQLSDPLLTPASLDQPEKREQLDALIARVRKHPGLYSYHLIDEPSADAFGPWGKLVAYLRERDPKHLAYINLLPMGATNEQLGTTGDVFEAYQEYLRRYIETVRPQLLSYDEYQFKNGGDTGGYLPNLALVRDAALEAGLPFLNIVQACSWHPGQASVPTASRIPTPDEVRYLAYTTLAYGAQGISYYVYSFPGHEGGMALLDGTPTPLYDAAKTINREFVAIATVLQSLRSLGVYHLGMIPPGVKPLPSEFPFKIDPPMPSIDYVQGERVQGILLSSFGPDEEEQGSAHVLIVNLDYKEERALRLTGPAPLEVFEPLSGKWTSYETPHADLPLPRGGGKLLRIHR